MHLDKNGKPPYLGAIGGAYTYSFTGTSIGMIVTLKCWCGAKVDLTGDL